MERYQPDQYGRMMPDAHGQWVSLRAAELTALDAAQKSSADAQATIAALQARVQARVQELEEITKVICGHCCEPMEIPSKAVLQSALTQRTAELEAVFNFVGVKYDVESKTWVGGQAPYLSAGTTKQEACIAAVDALRLACVTWETKYRDLHAELERVRVENRKLAPWVPE